MATYGQIRLRLSKLAAGVDRELIDGWIQDRYTQILDRLPWKRLEGETVIQSPPSYQVGTVTATQGSNAIVGVGTAWTQAMNGLMIRIANDQEFYVFTYVDATDATLDRPYEAQTDSISASAIATAGAGYQVGDLFWIANPDGLGASGIIQSAVAGAVTGYSITSPGNAFSVASGVATTTSGAGSGFTLNILTVGISSGLAYRIDQNIFTLPYDCRVLRAVRRFHPPGELKVISPGELNRIAPGRLVYGTPRYAVQTWDADTSPPLMQLELSPIPASPDSLGNTLSFAVDYIYDQPDLVASNTSFSLLPWARPAALIKGVQADIAEWQEKLTLAEAREAAFEKLVKQMAMINALQRGPQALRLAPELRGRGTPVGYHRAKHADRDYFGEDEYDA
jgi:hypothetical protein